MENKINIAEILRDMPKGTKLYSPRFGECNLDKVCTSNSERYPIVLLTSAGALVGFTKNGHYVDGFEYAEYLLFPSAKMRCWDKLFKRGDVLVDEDLETAVVFDGWANDDYTEFYTTINHYKISDAWGKGDICSTLLYTKATDEERAEFIAAAEKHFGGKYNPETLRVRPLKESFKSKCQFEPFQKVLVRDSCYDKWRANYFSHYDEDNSIFPYCCVGDHYKVCIAYEGNERLLDTYKNPE